MSTQPRYCPRCGEPLIESARFCSRCGLDLDAVGSRSDDDTDPAFVPPPDVASSPARNATVAAPRSRSGGLTTVLISLAVLAALGVGAWILLSQFPRRDRESAKISSRSAQKVDTVEEGSPTTTEPLPLEPDVPVARPKPAPKPDDEQQPPPPRRELTAEQATARLSKWIMVNHYYGSEAGCATLTNRGYRNRGYDVEVDATNCQRGGIDRWRVDSANGEVFRQVPDGRYLRP